MQPEIILRTSGLRNQKDLLLERACHNGELDRVERTFANSTFGDLPRKKGVHHIEKDILTNCLKLSIEQGHVEIMDFLIERGAEYEEFSVRASLVLASRQGHLKMLRVFCERFNPPTEWLNECLSESSHMRDLNVTKFLLENKADVSGNRGLLILLSSINADIMEKVKLFLDYGVDVTGNNGEVVEYVCKYNRIPYLELFIDRKLITINHPKIPTKIRDRLYEKKFYRKWRLIHHVKWFRKVIIPLYFSPTFPGGVSAKKDITNALTLE